MAHEEVAQRRHRIALGVELPLLDDWIIDAVRLDDEIWAATFVDGHRATELAAEAVRVSAAYKAARVAAGPPTEHVVINGRPVTSSLHLAETMHRLVAAGTLNPFNPLFASLFTDRRSEQHPIRRRQS